MVNGVINIGGNREVTIKELAEIIIRETGSKSKIVHVDPLKEGDMRRRQPDNSDMKALLNRPLIKVDEGIRKIIEKGLFELNIQ